MPFALSPSHRHFYRWYGYHSQSWLVYGIVLLTQSIYICIYICIFSPYTNYILLLLTLINYILQPYSIISHILSTYDLVYPSLDHRLSDQANHINWNVRTSQTLQAISICTMDRNAKLVTAVSVGTCHLDIKVSVSENRVYYIILYIQNIYI